MKGTIVNNTIKASPQRLTDLVRSVLTGRRTTTYDQLIELVPDLAEMKQGEVHQVIVDAGFHLDIEH